jgi:mRNA interferase MazF
VICDFGEVAIVPFPFIENDLTKIRPALVISNADFNVANGSTVLAMITSAAQSSWPSDLALSDSLGAGLLRPSYVRWKLFTIPNALIGRTVGSLAAIDQKQAKRALRKILF